MLPGWEESVGAAIEKLFAEQIGKRVIILEDEYGFSYDDEED